jgi:hypothetical protein
VADIPSDGNTRVAFVAAIANQNGPTVAELNAGILLQSTMTPDGLLGFEPKTSDVDNSALDSTFDTVTIGRDQFSGTMLRFKKQSGTDTIFATLTRGTTGFVVVRRDIASSTGWATGQIVEVYPVTCGRPRRLQPVRNELTKWESDVKISSAPSLFVAVV